MHTPVLSSSTFYQDKSQLLYEDQGLLISFSFQPFSNTSANFALQDGRTRQVEPESVHVSHVNARVLRVESCAALLDRHFK